MHRSPRPSMGFGPPPSGTPTPTSPTGSSPWLDEWRHWMGMTVADLANRVMRLEEVEEETRDITQENGRRIDRMERENGRRLDRLIEMVARLDERTLTRPAPHAEFAPPRSWRDRLEMIKAVGTAAMWVAGPILILLHHLGWIDATTVSALKAALGAVQGPPGGGEHGP